MKIKWKTIIGLLVVSLVLSCNQDETDTPEVLLSESQMIDIMTDVQIIEGDINYRKMKGMKVDSLSLLFYNQLFEHYSITDSIFRENMEYYTLYPAVLENIMDSVTNRLTKAQADSI